MAESFEGKPVMRDIAEGGVRDAAFQFGVLHLRVGEDLGDGVDRAAGDAGGVELRDELGGRVVRRRRLR